MVLLSLIPLPRPPVTVPFMPPVGPPVMLLFSFKFTHPSPLHSGLRVTVGTDVGAEKGCLSRADPAGRTTAGLPPPPAPANSLSEDQMTTAAAAAAAAAAESNTGLLPQLSQSSLPSHRECNVPPALASAVASTGKDSHGGALTSAHAADKAGSGAAGAANATTLLPPAAVDGEGGEGGQGRSGRPETSGGGEGGQDDNVPAINTHPSKRKEEGNSLISSASQASEPTA